MNPIMILAQAATEQAAKVPAPQPAPVPESFVGHVPVEEIWQFVLSVPWMHAAILFAVGMLFLVYGWRIYKGLVVMDLTLAGLFAGVVLGRYLGSGMWGGILGVLACSVVSWPFMKYCVSLLGAATGALLGAALWRCFLLPDALIWCGGLLGLLAGGFMAFSSFRNSVMLFTTMQGAAAIAVGTLALLAKHPMISVGLTQWVYDRAFILPLALLVPWAIGMFWQRKLLKESADWKMPD